MFKLPFRLQLRELDYTKKEQLWDVYTYALTSADYLELFYEHLSIALTANNARISDDFLHHLFQNDTCNSFIHRLCTKLQMRSVHNNGYYIILPHAVLQIAQFSETVRNTMVQWCYDAHFIPPKEVSIYKDVIALIQEQRPLNGLAAALGYEPSIASSLTTNEVNDLIDWFTRQEHDASGFQTDTYHGTSFIEKPYFSFGTLLAVAEHSPTIAVWLYDTLKDKVKKQQFDIDEELDNIRNLPFSSLTFFIEYFRTIIPFEHHLSNPAQHATKDLMYSHRMAYIAYGNDMTFDEYMSALINENDMTISHMVELVSLKVPDILERMERIFNDPESAFVKSKDFCPADVILIALESNYTYTQLFQQYEEYHQRMKDYNFNDEDLSCTDVHHAIIDTLLNGTKKEMSLHF